jgi:hypothetical protein
VHVCEPERGRLSVPCGKSAPFIPSAPPRKRVYDPTAGTVFLQKRMRTMMQMPVLGKNIVSLHFLHILVTLLSQG